MFTFYPTGCNSHSILSKKKHKAHDNHPKKTRTVSLRHSIPMTEIPMEFYPEECGLHDIQFQSRQLNSLELKPLG